MRLHVGVFAFVLAGAKGQDIFQAVEQDSMAAIKKALEADAGALNRPGPGGQSPLMNAVLSGKPKAVKYLLKRKADPTVAEKDGYTPMHGAGFQGRADIARLLIDHGLDPFDVHQDGHAPMMRACWGQEPRHTATVKVFMDAGATRSAMQECLNGTRNQGTQREVKAAMQRLSSGAHTRKEEV
eukprot:2231232-Prymnesium_polylepis.2